MNRLNQAAAAARHAAAWLLPAGRRDWVTAIWAEAHEVPPGLARLAWRAGGAWVLARQALLPRRLGRAAMFAAAAAPASTSASDSRAACTSAKSSTARSSPYGELQEPSGTNARSSRAADPRAACRNQTRLPGDRAVVRADPSEIGDDVTTVGQSQCHSGIVASMVKRRRMFSDLAWGTGITPIHHAARIHRDLNGAGVPGACRESLPSGR